MAKTTTRQPASVEILCCECEMLLGEIELSRFNPQIDGKAMCRYCIAENV